MKIKRIKLNRQALLLSLQLLLAAGFIACFFWNEQIRAVICGGWWQLPAAGALAFFACLLLAGGMGKAAKGRPQLPAGLLAALLALAAGMTMLLIPAMRARTAAPGNRVELYCGEKGEMSRGSEVWLHAYEVDGERWDMESADIAQMRNISFSQERKEYYYIADNGPDGYLSLKLPRGKTATLTFFRHDWAGIVGISVNGGEAVPVDLFAPEADFFQFQLQLGLGGYRDTLSRVMLGICLLGCCSLIFLAGKGFVLCFFALHRGAGEKEILRRLALLALWAFAAGLVFWLWGFDRLAEGLSFWMRLLTLAVLTAFAGYLFICRGILSEAFAAAKERSRLSVFSAAAALLAALIFLSPLLDRAFPHVVELYCGEQSGQSQGSEVWLSSYTVDGKMRNIRSLTVAEAENVHYRESFGSYLYNNGNGGGYMRLELPRGKTASLGFWRYERGGIVRISVDGADTQQVDLYAPRTESFPVDLELGSGPRGGLPACAKLILGFCGCFSLLYLVILGSAALAVRERDCAGKKEGRALLWVSGLLLPAAILFYLYRNNSDYISFSYLLVLCAVVAAVNTILFWAVEAAAQSPLAAWACCLIMSIFLFESGSIADRLSRRGMPENWTVFFCLGAAVLLFFAAMQLLGRLRAPLPAATLLAVFTGIFCLMNLAPSLKIAAQKAFADDSLAIKENYAVDAAKVQAAPHVYWVHCDGLLGFDAVEKYYGDDQAGLRAGLEERGFVVDEDACFAAGRSTRSCVPALTCPDFYDRVMREGIAQAKDDNIWCLENKGLLEAAKAHNEMIEAFRKISPVTVFSSLSYKEIFVYDTLYSTTSNSVIRQEVWENTGLQNDIFLVETFTKRLVRPLYLAEALLTEDLNIVHYISLNNYHEIIQEISLNSETLAALKAGLQDSSSSLTLVALAEAHYPFGRDENGEWVKAANRDPLDYLPQHRYAVKVLLKAVDVILAHDPDAVIVLQADHGLHGCSEISFREAFGEGAAADELWNQVFSAVRIPGQYQNGEEHYAYENPLNISRYLVNSFVGRNYEYLE